MEKFNNSSVLDQLFESDPEIPILAKKLAENTLASNHIISDYCDSNDLYQMAMIRLLNSGVDLDFSSSEHPRSSFLALFKKVLIFACADEIRKINGRSDNGGNKRAHFNVISINRKIRHTPSLDESNEEAFTSDKLISDKISTTDNFEKSHSEKIKIIESLKDTPWFIKIAVLEYLGIEPEPFYPQNERQKIIYEALKEMEPDNSPFVQYCLNHLRQINGSSYVFKPEKEKGSRIFMKKLEFLNMIPVEMFEKQYEKLNERELTIFVRYYIIGEEATSIMKDFNISQSRITQILQNIGQKLTKINPDIKVA